jgi:hypothetical protein
MHVDKGQVDLSGLMAGVGLHNGPNNEEGAKNDDCEAHGQKQTKNGRVRIRLASNSPTTLSRKHQDTCRIDYSPKQSLGAIEWKTKEWGS